MFNVNARHTICTKILQFQTMTYYCFRLFSFLCTYIPVGNIIYLYFLVTLLISLILFIVSTKKTTDMIRFRVLYECENFERIVKIIIHCLCFALFHFLSLIIKHSFLCANFTFKCVCDKRTKYHRSSSCVCIQGSL